MRHWARPPSINHRPSFGVLEHVVGFAIDADTLIERKVIADAGGKRSEPAPEPSPSMCRYGTTTQLSVE
jgi:hypothetical protein